MRYDRTNGEWTAIQLMLPNKPRGVPRVNDRRVLHTRAASTGRLIHLLFTGLLVAENGKIKLLRESLNTLANAQALSPNGVADLPPPEQEIFSVPPDYMS